MTKTRYDNNVIDCLNLVYLKIETELLGTISLGAVHDENHTGQRHDQSHRRGLLWK